jgi:PAS domain S-box-containing protein
VSGIKKNSFRSGLLLFLGLALVLSLAEYLVHRFFLLPLVHQDILGDPGRLIWTHLAIIITLIAACLLIYGVFRYRYHGLRKLSEGDRRFRSLFENSRDAIFIRSAQGVYIDMNQAMMDLFGFERGEMVGMNVDRIYANPADRIKLEAAIREKGFVRDYEVVLRKKDATEMICLVNANEWMDSGDSLVGYEGIIRDITEQRRTQESLRESEEHYRLLFDNSPLGIFHYDKNGVIIDCNQKFVDVIGSSRKALVGLDMLNSLRDEKMVAQIREALEGRAGYYEGNYKSITADKVTPVRVLTRSLAGDDGSFLGAVGIVEDVSESMASLEAHRKSEERFRAIFEGAAMGVALTTLDGTLVEANSTFAEMTGYGLDELRGRPVHGLTHPDDFDAEKAIIAQLTAGSINRCQIVKRYMRKDGGQIWVRLSASLMHDRSGRAEYVLGLIENITERKKAREELAREKEQLAVTLTSIGDGVITTDVKGRVVMINRVAENLTGWKCSEAAGRPLGEVFAIINEATRQPCESPADRVIATGSVVGLANHTLLIAKDGTERVIADSGAPIRDSEGNITGVVLVFRDVTEARRTEEELRKAQKLESIGVLAGGIAHDFNNILTSIMGSISLVKVKLDQESDLHKILMDAERASRQARELTQQLLTFSRGGAPIKKTVLLSGLLRDICSFSTRGSNVKCEFSINADLWPADIDVGQISQVVNNMLINALQAMPDGGIIRVSASNVKISDEPHSLMYDSGAGAPVPPGSYIRISIDDEGHGIPAELMGKIFDPYFTTKEKGVGLGLAIAYSIIRRHEGHVEVKSRIGEGTSFSIYLPAALGRGTAENPDSAAAVHGSGRVLVMDDDENILKVTGNILRHLGYEVAMSHNGYETIEMYRKAMEEKAPFDAVIMDLTVPGSMGGRDCIDHLLKMDPGVKAVVSSGYSNDPVMADHARYGFKGIITKPYRIEDLGTVLARVTGKKNDL